MKIDRYLLLKFPSNVNGIFPAEPANFPVKSFFVCDADTNKSMIINYFL
jgi:hypothetical protein